MAQDMNDDWWRHRHHHRHHWHHWRRRHDWDDDYGYGRGWRRRGWW
jgi:hypothetical protein